MSELEIEAAMWSMATREMLILEVLKLRIKLDAAHEQIGELNWERDGGTDDDDCTCV